jgi:hypothetical protein
MTAKRQRAAEGHEQPGTDPGTGVGQRVVLAGGVDHGGGLGGGLPQQAEVPADDRRHRGHHRPGHQPGGDRSPHQQHAAAGEVGGERALTGTYRAARHRLPPRDGLVLRLEESRHDLNLGGAAVPADRSKVSAAETMVAYASPLVWAGARHPGGSTRELTQRSGVPAQYASTLEQWCGRQILPSTS